MREILFRGKTTDGDWTYGYYVFTPKRTGIFGQTISSADFDRHYILTMRFNFVKEVVPTSVGQFTSLCDKNGKKIFEGDIVKATIAPKMTRNYVLGTVVFENGTFKLLVFGQVKDGEFSFICSRWDDDKKTSKYAIENNFIFRGYTLEVIGNIHDNPELLKGGET